MHCGSNWFDRHDSNSGMAQLFVDVNLDFMSGVSNVHVSLGYLYKFSLIRSCISCVPIPHFQ